MTIIIIYYTRALKMLHIILSNLCCYTCLLLQFIHKFLILLLLFLLFIKCFLCPELSVFCLYFKSCIILFCPDLCLWFCGFSWFTFTCCWSSSFLSTLFKIKKQKHSSDLFSKYHTNTIKSIEILLKV